MTDTVFDQDASFWWDQDGPFKMLHRMNHAFVHWPAVAILVSARGRTLRQTTSLVERDGLQTGVAFACENVGYVSI